MLALFLLLSLNLLDATDYYATDEDAFCYDTSNDCTSKLFPCSLKYALSLCTGSTLYLLSDVTVNTSVTISNSVTFKPIESADDTLTLKSSSSDTDNYLFLISTTVAFESLALSLAATRELYKPIPLIKVTSSGHLKLTFCTLLFLQYRRTRNQCSSNRLL